jgi:TatD DNase family protein
MFDSHCHLTDIENPEEVLRQTTAAGVTGILCCGYHSASLALVVDFRRRFPNLPVAMGLHPWFANEKLEPILELIEQERPTAIGECGLEGVARANLPDFERQVRVFEAQLDAASRLGLSVTVHSRKAVNRVVDIALAFPKVRGALHAYSGSFEQVSKLLERGWMIGIGGSITRESASRLRKLACQIPLPSILLETDAPAVGVQGILPPNVRPYHLRYVAVCVANLRGISVDELGQVSADNARRLFGITGGSFDAEPGTERDAK